MCSVLSMDRGTGASGPGTPFLDRRQRQSGMAIGAVNRAAGDLAASWSLIRVHNTCLDKAGYAVKLWLKVTMIWHGHRQGQTGSTLLT